ncbi:MAG: PorT family protein [Bacteroidia bacterium]|nr:MAG: PorT family protein [Bacteroidia bacterium]
MKKILLSAFALVTISAVNAQLGVEVGGRFSNISGKDAPSAAKMKAGFQAGVNYAIGIADEFYIQPGVNFVANGFKAEVLSKDVVTNYNYLQVPVTLQYKPVLGAGKLVLGVGPYAGFGIGDISVKTDGDKVKSDWPSGMKKFDAGAKVQVGYELNNGVYFILNADQGLTKLSDSNNPPKTFNSAFGVSVGFRL